MHFTRLERIKREAEKHMSKKNAYKQHPKNKNKRKKAKQRRKKKIFECF